MIKACKFKIIFQTSYSNTLDCTASERYAASVTSYDAMTLSNDVTLPMDSSHYTSFQVIKSLIKYFALSNPYLCDFNV